jgi:predicted O-methyltransferase YrrM
VLVQRLKAGIRRWTPKPVFNALEYQRQRMRVASVSKNRCDFSSLGHLSGEECRRLFDAGAIDDEWERLAEHLQAVGVWNKALATGGVDLKVLYYLARRRGFRSVLEVGTHVGGSTVTLASALARGAAETGDRPELVTVDIVDVNDPSRGPWCDAGMQRPPRDVVDEMGLNVSVEFVTSPSLPHLESATRSYDFVFLDGDHRGDTTYREIGLAASRLAPGGLIALHDYSPRVIFATLLDGRAIPGPYVAARRVLEERPGLALRTFEQVPWPDGIRVSYVAVLCKR